MAKKQNKSVAKRFKVGDWVTIRGISCFFYNENSEKIHHIVPCELRDGQIVGATYKRLGLFERGSSGSSWSGEDEYEPNSFLVKDTVFVWKISIGLMNKFIYAANELVMPVLDKSLWNLEGKPHDNLPILSVSK